ncbi:LysR family transcriptional regulator [Neisseria chenwenguii]|uniref:LysR family transcriptional regulator n=1 Tax=Neisseria chenwenguii TaxID=1853278 RepID=A0A220S0L0_9NEIS|nr:LysR family transcriptional regulator [Neisseria chenwenguii]ASK26953.1 LysR family transcriptional regulator [Neisseria chenwenguii]
MNLDWNDIHYFLLLVEKQTLTATAAALQVEHSTVSHRIERLEKQLDLHLFDRINKRYLLTADGERLYAEARKLQFNVCQFAQAAQDSRQAVTEVSVSVPPFVAYALIASRLAEFYRRTDTIRLVLSSNTAISSLHQRQADITLRFALPEQNDLVVRRLRDVHYGWFAHRDYARNTPETDWQYIRFAVDGLRSEWLKKQLADKNIRFACNDFAVMKSAVRQQLGVGWLPFEYGETADFVRVHTDEIFSGSLHLVMHEDVRHSQKVRAVADFLGEVLGRK